MCAGDRLFAGMPVALKQAKRLPTVSAIAQLVRGRGPGHNGSKLFNPRFALLFPHEDAIATIGRDDPSKRVADRLVEVVPYTMEQRSAAVKRQT